MLAQTVAHTDGQTLGILKYKIQLQTPLCRVGDLAVSAASLSSSSRSCCKRSCSSFHALIDPARTVGNTDTDSSMSGVSGGCGVFCTLRHGRRKRSNNNKNVMKKRGKNKKNVKKTLKNVIPAIIINSTARGKA